MGLLDFFATGQGVLALGSLAALIVLLWDWRVALIALVLIQIGVATLLVQIEGASGQIMFVQTLIVALCAVMIAIAKQVGSDLDCRSDSSPWLCSAERGADVLGAETAVRLKRELRPWASRALMDRWGYKYETREPLRVHPGWCRPYGPRDPAGRRLRSDLPPRRR